MQCIKSFLFYAFLTLCKIQAKVIERDETHEMATLPDTLQPVENEILKHQANFSNISNDVEVFKDKLGPRKENQEEEIEAEGNEEEKPEVDEPKEEEQEAEEEPAVQPDTELDDNAAPEVEINSAAEAEPEPAENAEPEEPKQEETPAEPEAEGEKQPEPGTGVDEEKEPIPNTQTDDSEMPNDEPAKEEENNEKQDESNAPPAENEPTETLKTKDTDKRQVSCFTCTSNEDAKCPIKPTKQITCPKANEADVGKHNGCYTLYQAATNITTRGCVDELAEEGLRYCLTNEKLCSLCYSSGCNDQSAPSNTAKLQSNIYLLLFLTVSCKIIMNFVNLKIFKV